MPNCPYPRNYTHCLVTSLGQTRILAHLFRSFLFSTVVISTLDLMFVVFSIVDASWSDGCLVSGEKLTFIPELRVPVIPDMDPIYERGSSNYMS